MRCAHWDISRTLALTSPSLTLARHDSKVASATDQPAEPPALLRTH